MGSSRQLVDELLDVSTVVGAPDELLEVTDVVDVRTACCVCLRMTLLGADTNVYLSLVMVRLKPRKGAPPPCGLHLCQVQATVQATVTCPA